MHKVCASSCFILVCYWTIYQHLSGLLYWRLPNYIMWLPSATTEATLRNMGKENPGNVPGDLTTNVMKTLHKRVTVPRDITFGCNGWIRARLGLVSLSNNLKTSCRKILLSPKHAGLDIEMLIILIFNRYLSLWHCRRNAFQIAGRLVNFKHRARYFARFYRKTHSMIIQTTPMASCY